MWFFNKFNKDEQEVIKEDEEFLSILKELQNELTGIETGKAEFIDLQELDDGLESTIANMKIKLTEN